jgi:hypothetical protein
MRGEEKIGGTREEDKRKEKREWGRIEEKI